MGRSWTRYLAGAALLGAMVGSGVGCGVVTIGGKPLGGPSPEPAKTAEPESAREASWDGRWGSTFGTISFTQKGRKVSGVYPGGTLECDAPGIDLLCKWADGTGAGRAKFRWGTTHKAPGTFGNGESDTDQGEWVLTWPAPPEPGAAPSNGGGGGSGKFSVTLKNDCKAEVSYCIQTCDNSMDCTINQKKKLSKSGSSGSYTSHTVQAGAKLMDGQCKATIKTFGGGSETFTLCK
jgi:hypothetical protein